MIRYSPILIKMFNVEVMITILDNEKVLHQEYSPNINRKLILPIGNKLQDTDVMKVAMVHNKTIHTELPKEAIGVAQRAFISPLYNKNGRVIGSIGVGLSVDHKGISKAVQHLASATEELEEISKNV